MAIFSSCFLAEHSGRPTSRLPTAFCLAPHGPVIITRPTRLATFPFMPCVAHFRPPLLCPRGYLWRQSCDWSSIWSTFGKLRSREAGKQLLDGIWAIQNQLDNKWGQSNQSCRSKAFIDQLQDAESRWAIKASVTVPLFVFLPIYLISDLYLSDLSSQIVLKRKELLRDEQACLVRITNQYIFIHLISNIKIITWKRYAIFWPWIYQVKKLLRLG